MLRPDLDVRRGACHRGRVVPPSPRPASMHARMQNSCPAESETSREPDLCPLNTSFAGECCVCNAAVQAYGGAKGRGVCQREMPVLLDGPKWTPKWRLLGGGNSPESSPSLHAKPGTNKEEEVAAAGRGRVKSKHDLRRNLGRWNLR